MAVERLNLSSDRIKTYTGSDRPAKRGLLWEEGKLIIATPQVIRNDVDSGLISLDNVGLLIVDEAHHAELVAGVEKGPRLLGDGLDRSTIWWDRSRVCA